MLIGTGITHPQGRVGVLQAIGPKHGETGLVLVGERGQGFLFPSQ